MRGRPRRASTYAARDGKYASRLIGVIFESCNAADDRYTPSLRRAIAPAVPLTGSRGALEQHAGRRFTVDERVWRKAVNRYPARPPALGPGGFRSLRQEVTGETAFFRLQTTRYMMPSGEDHDSWKARATTCRVRDHLHCAAAAPHWWSRPPGTRGMPSGPG